MAQVAKTVELYDGTQGTVEQRVAEITADVKHMAENYDGCDWCCGGGDDAMEDHTEELKLYGIDINDLDY